MKAPHGPVMRARAASIDASWMLAKQSAPGFVRLVVRARPGHRSITVAAAGSSALTTAHAPGGSDSKRLALAWR